MSDAIRPYCAKCGSHSIAADCSAEWDEELNEWSLTTIYDNKQCLVCGYDSNSMPWEELT